MQLVVEFAIRTVLIAAATAGVLRALTINTAAARHAVWTGVLIVMLLLPVWTVWGPRVAVRVLAPVPEKPTQAAATTDAFQPTTVAPDLLHAETSPPAPRTLEWRWTACLLGVYLIGVAALLVRLVLGTLQAHLFVHRACRRDGRLFSASCAAPVTVGWFRPVVVLPEGWSEWPAAQLDAVLTHESEHARRRDPLIQWLALLNRAVFWFHPLAWWLERRLAALAEEACDAAVLAHGHDPRDYSRYLIDMARSVASTGARLHVWGMAMPGRFLELRIRRIVEGGPLPRLTRARLVATATACMATSIIFAAGSVDHQVGERDANQDSVPAQAQISRLNGQPPGDAGQEPRPASGSQSMPAVVYAQPSGRVAGRSPERAQSLGWIADGSPFATQLSDDEAAALEQQLGQNPENENARAELLRYYWAKGMAQKRVESIFWLIEHHPASAIHGRMSAAILEAWGFSGARPNSEADWQRARSLWEMQANRHADDADVLHNAARFLVWRDPGHATEWLKRARQLDPAHHTDPLASLYGALLSFMAVPDQAAFRARIRAELLISNDALLVGKVARELVTYGSSTALTEPARDLGEIRELAIQLLTLAARLEPNNREWSDLMEGAKGIPPVPRAPERANAAPATRAVPQRIRVGGQVQAAKLRQAPAPVYPAAARTQVVGSVQLQVIIGKDGHVVEAKLLSGPEVLSAAAIDAAKQYVYAPTLLNGEPVEVVTTVEVRFGEGMFVDRTYSGDFRLATDPHDKEEGSLTVFYSNEPGAKVTLRVAPDRSVSIAIPLDFTAQQYEVYGRITNSTRRNVYVFQDVASRCKAGSCPEGEEFTPWYRAREVVLQSGDYVFHAVVKEPSGTPIKSYKVAFSVK